MCVRERDREREREREREIERGNYRSTSPGETGNFLGMNLRKKDWNMKDKGKI